MAICSCSSWSERPSNWSIGCGEEEEEETTGDILVFKRKRRRKEDEDEVGDMEEEDAGEEELEAEGGDEEKGESMDTPKEGKPVDGFWRGQQRFGVDTLFPVGTM